MGGEIFYTEDGVDYPTDPDTLVSMNFWGFTPSYIDYCREGLSEFLRENLAKNPDKCEYCLPTVVSELISRGACDVKVLDNSDKWYGVTYKEDKPDVCRALGELVKSGKYPENF